MDTPPPIQNNSGDLPQSDNPAFNQNYFRIQRKFFKFFGAAFRVFDAQGQLAFYSKQKAFKLKEDIRLYVDEAMTREALVIQAQQVIDFSAAYSVIDPSSNTLVGSLRRKGFKSLFRDEWVILDAAGNEIGNIKEDSGMLAFVRRFLTNLVPQTFHAHLGMSPVFTIKQLFNPFILKWDVDFSADTQGQLDRRLGMAAAVLIAAIEGRQG